MGEYRERAQSMGVHPVVLMDGPFNADIAVIGEGPGEKECQTGIPFAGGSGHKMWERMRKLGFTRQNVYVTNVVKRQISLSAKGDSHLRVGRHEQTIWDDLLRWEITQLPNCQYILCLGNMALTAITGLHGITNYRGSVFHDVKIHDRLYTVIVAFNPAYVIREPKWESIFDFDIARFGLVHAGKWKPYVIEHIINPSYKDATDWLDKMVADKIPVSYDIEIIGTETACIGITNDNHLGMCINFRNLDGHHYSLEEECSIRRKFQHVLANPEVQLVGQNTNFDNTWLWYKDYIQVRKTWFDTLLAHHTLYPKLPHGLGFLVAQYTTHPFYKDEKDTWKDVGDLDAFWRYNVKDICLTRAVMMRTWKELREQQLDKFFFEHVMMLQPHLVRATVYGVKIDAVLKARLAVDIGEEVAKLRAEFIDLARIATKDPTLIVNPNSPSQLGELFFNRLHLIGRGTSTDELNRKKMKEHIRTTPEAFAMLSKLDKYKEEAKYYSTYVEMKIDPDDRIRCEYKQYGTSKAPGRLSSSGVLWGSGTNLQNQPKRAYEMFITDNDDCAFGYFDLEQAEARVVAFLANIAKWKADFERARLTGDYDCHRALAADMWKIPYDDVPKEDEIDGKKTKRFIAKRCRHGLNYRMLAPRLADTTGLPIYEAQNAFNIYHRVNPELKVWWDATLREIRTNKAIYNSFGRRFILMERPTDEALDAVVAFRPQSTIGDKVCQVWYKSEDDPDWPWPVRVALNNHDSLICHGPIPLVKEALQIMKKYAEEPIFINGEECIIPAALKMTKPDATGKHRWSTLEKLKA